MDTLRGHSKELVALSQVVACWASTLLANVGSIRVGTRRNEGDATRISG